MFVASEQHNEYYMLLMIEKWKEALDETNLARVLITDLTKSFYCLNHELFIAIQENYGFNHESLYYIFSYL